MVVVLWIVVGILAGALLALSAWAQIVGLIGMINRGELQRCKQCGKYGMAPHASLHRDGCPEGEGFLHRHHVGAHR